MESCIEVVVVVSARMTTIVLPACSGRLASRAATATAAPLETPQ